MANIPHKFSSLRVSNFTSNQVLISTRPSPQDGFVVEAEHGIVMAYSPKFHNHSQAAANYKIVFDLLGKESKAFGGNAVMGTQMEIKQILQTGRTGHRQGTNIDAWLVIHCTGTACTVTRKRGGLLGSMKGGPPAARV